MKKILFFFYIACITTSIIFAMEQPTSHVWDGKKYSQNNTPQFQHAMEILNRELFNNKNVAQAKVIDICCGSGNIPHEISQYTAYVVGIDASESMIQEAKQQYKDIKNLRFQQQDVTIFNPEFVLSSDPKNRFNYVTSFASLHWIKNKEAVIKNVAQYIALDGIFLAAGSGRDDDHPLIHALNDLKNSGPETVKPLLQNFNIDNHYFPLDKNVMHKLLTDANFQSIDIQEKQDTVFFKNKDEHATFFSVCLGGIGQLKDLPAPQKKAFFDLLSAKYVTYVTLTEKGEIPHTRTSIIIKASLAGVLKK